ncbi:IS481 family transposase, partial [Alkalilimnicola sp. S0819]|uniref:IS481 family transposase n=1 Tax=Alkalilimnicola sp. S0819 TaxID=2613922 RepID=UPI0012623146
MKIRLHANAATTPRIRREIQQSTDTNRALAARYNISIDTVRRWRQRDDVNDRSHTRHRLHTTITPAQEVIAVELRKLLLLPLDDLLVVVREFLNPHASRSGLDRCLRRHGVSRLADLREQQEPAPAKTAHKGFKPYEPGYLHIDYKYLPQMPDEDSRRYLFVAIDRATRWVYLELRADKSMRAATGFLKQVLAKVPFKVHHVLTDNDKAFTDRLSGRGPTGTHPFDRICSGAGAEHRLIPVRRPQTNGMVERFNGRISEVLQTHRFDSRLDLEQTLKRYCHLYNHHIPQKALGHKAPIQAMREWQKRR